jgi:hypothetical protein
MVSGLESVGCRYYLGDMEGCPRRTLLSSSALFGHIVAGEVPWDAVHEYAVEMEWTNAVDFPPRLKDPLGALHMAFLADERDDSQFRLDRHEISKLLNDLDQAQAGQGNT